MMKKPPFWMIATLALIAAGGSSGYVAAATSPATNKSPSSQSSATQPSPSAAKNISTGSIVGWLELSDRLRQMPKPYAWVDSSQLPPSLEEVLSQLKRVADQPQYKGVVVYLDQPQLTLTQAMTIGKAMKEVRAAGKKVLCFSVAYDLRSYLLASYANLILLQHRGSVALSGMAIEQYYLAGLLKKLGVQADLLQIGKYKGAEEPFTREGPSKAWQENLGHLVDGLYSQVIATIAKNRGVTKAAVEKMMHDSWGMSDEDALKQGVVDRLVDRDLVSVTQLEFGSNFTWDDEMGIDQSSGTPTDNPFAVLRALFQQPQSSTNGPTIAVIHALGEITSGKSRQAVGPMGSNSIGSRTMVKLLGKLDSDPNVRGVVIRINSPGGSALASELIWQALRKLSSDKPVFMSVSGMAASGAYYISSASDEIYVSPESIVGSIGVVGGKIVLGGLYQKLGIHVVDTSRGPWGDIFTSTQPFTPAQRQVVRASMVRTYKEFLNRVRTGRGKRLKKPLDQLAKGRVFTGTEAVALGLADHIGTENQAVAALAKRAGLKTGQFAIKNYPGPLSLQDFLQGILGADAPRLASRAPLFSSANQSVLSSVAALLGPEGWQRARMELSGLMELRHEPVLMMMPTAIVIK